MPATNPALLLEPCYTCLGMSLADAMQIALWDSISQADYDSDPVADFIARAGITDQSQIDAVTVLHAAAVANGWWDKCDLIYPFVGGTAQAHAQNLKSANFTITWNGTVTHNANGITGDGATGYGGTGYSPSTGPLWSLNSAHLGIYRRTTGISINRAYFAVLEVANNATIQRSFGTTLSAILNGGTSTISSAVLGWLVGSRINATESHIYLGAADDVDAGATNGIAALPLYVLARNNNGIANGWSESNLAFATAGSGLTFAEYGVMAANIQTFQTALGRQV